MSSCIRCLVRGRVQGVWYRGFTQQAARRLGVTGWARNLPDGRVELLACGSDEQLAELRRILREGPPAARVDGVECEPAAGPAPDDFRTF